MSVYPVALKLDALPCVVVGEGAEAELRAGALVRAGAAVTVIAKEPSAELIQAEARLGFVLHQRAFQATDLDDAMLVVLADRDAALAQQIGALARARRILFCAIDQPADNSFIHMARLSAGSLGVALTTDGRAPVLARRLREELERVFAAANLADFVERLARRRARVAPEERRALMTNIASGIRFTGKLELPDIDDG